ncbi:MAG: radical SAM protein [Nitrospirota bacterium]
MKVLLINPAFNRYGGLQGHGGSMVPINLCYLAAYARKAHPDVEFKILDSEILSLSHEETVREAEKFSPGLIGISANTCVFDSVINLSHQLKARLPKVPIIIGGPHPSALPEGSLFESKADFVGIGEGEITFSELISHIKKRDNDWSKIDGIGYRNEYGEVKINPPRSLIKDLDIIPFPARDFVDNNLYSPAPTKRVSLGPNTLLTTSRGCPYNCGFCGARTVWTRGIRTRSTKNIIEEIEECVGKYGIRSFNLTDEFFTAKKNRVLDICRAICERKFNISWVCFARAQGLDKETLEAIKEAGCKELSFGIESGNEEILKKIDKSLDLKEAERVIRLTKKVGIKTHASYIMGYLNETEETMRDTIRLAKKLNTDIAAFFIASPLPGTPFYHEALQKGYIRSNASWINYSPLSNQDSVLSMPDLNAEVIRKWHRKAIRSYYLRPSYMLRRLLALRNWNEVKNLIEGLKLFFKIKK